MDCYGPERLSEEWVWGNFEVVLVCFVKKQLAVQVPGGRKNAMMVQKSTLAATQEPDTAGFFWLGPTTKIVKRAFQLQTEGAGKSSRRAFEHNRGRGGGRWLLLK